MHIGVKFYANFVLSGRKECFEKIRHYGYRSGPLGEEWYEYFQGSNAE